MGHKNIREILYKYFFTFSLNCIASEIFLRAVFQPHSVHFTLFKVEYLFFRLPLFLSGTVTIERENSLVVEPVDVMSLWHHNVKNGDSYNSDQNASYYDFQVTGTS